MDNPVPKLEPVSIARIQDLFKRLTDLLVPFQESTLEGMTFHQVRRAIKRAIPGVSSEAVYASCLSDAGHVFSAARIQKLAWRLAGNVPRLKRGEPATLWEGQGRPEWCALEFVHSTLARSRWGKFGARFTCHGWSGSLAGVLFERFFSQAEYVYLAPSFGFTKPHVVGHSQTMPLQHSSQFVGLRFYGLAEARAKQTGRPRPYFRQVRVSPSFRELNRSLLKARYRYTGPCPRGYLHACHQCVIGLDECNLATHPTTYYVGNCPHCLQAAPFDSTLSAEMCVRCYHREQTALKPKPA